MGDRLLDWLDRVPMEWWVYLIVSLIALLVGECYAHEQAVRAVDRLDRKAQRIEWNVREWRDFYAVASDSFYACRHPGWHRDTTRGPDLTVGRDGTVVRETGRVAHRRRGQER